MNPSDYPITDLIPQRPPFVMIDRLISNTEKSARGSLFIDEKNVLCHAGFFQESGMMEFIAQTAAAFTGYIQLISAKVPTRGYIGAIKNLAVYSRPSVNTEIQSEITVDTELLGYSVITGKIFQENRLLAECEMRILLEVA
jgi:predicted hotdog family 3-hydroxylacyl-ACP dehydratase